MKSKMALLLIVIGLLLGTIALPAQVTASGGMIEVYRETVIVPASTLSSLNA